MTLYDPDIQYYYLDTISDRHYISSDGKYYLMQYADILSLDPQVTSNDCLSDDIVKVEIISNIDDTPSNGSPSFQSITSGIESPVKPVTSHLLDVQCKSK